MYGCWCVLRKIVELHASLHHYLATDHLVGGRTTDQGFAGKDLLTARTGTGSLREIFTDTLLKTLYQCPLATFAVAVQLGFTAGAEDINGFHRPLGIGFSHEMNSAQKLKDVFRSLTWCPCTEADTMSAVQLSAKREL